MVPFISDQATLLALFVGRRSELPRAAIISVSGVAVRVYVDTELPEQMIGITCLLQREADDYCKDGNRAILEGGRIKCIF